MSNARWLVGGAWRAAVPEREEPRHHGPIKVSTQYPTPPHLATHLPTFSVRRLGRADARSRRTARGAGLRACVVVGDMPTVCGRWGAFGGAARAFPPIGGECTSGCGGIGPPETAHRDLRRIRPPIPMSAWGAAAAPRLAAAARGSAWLRGSRPAAAGAGPRA